MTNHVVEVLTNEHAEIELRTAQAKRPAQYDGPGDRPIPSVLIRRQAKSATALTVPQLLAAARTVGVDLSALAVAAPEDVAAAIGHLEDHGRVIRDHPLFADLIDQQRDLLPRIEDGHLVWYTFDTQHGELNLQPRRLRLD